MIYYTFGKPAVLSVKPGMGLFFTSLGMIYQPEANHLVTCIGDHKKVANSWVNSGNQWLRVCVLDEGLNLSDAQNGDIFLIDEDDNVVDLKPEIAYLLRYALPQYMLPPNVVGNISNYKEKNDNCLLLANVKSNKFIYRNDNMYLQKLVLLSDGIYGYHFRSKTLKKLDHQLNDVWSFDPGATRITPMQIVPYEDKIYFYPGNTKGGIVDKKPVPGEAGLNLKHVVRENATLYCLDRGTGEIVWQQLFSIALNDVIFHEGKLYAVGEYECYRLSADSGEIECQQQMAANAGGKHYNLLAVIDNRLWVAIEHPYFQAHCLLILNLDTLDLEKSIDIPAPYALDQLIHYDGENRQAYYRLKPRYEAVYQEHMSPLLEIDIDELDTAITFEDKPGLDVEIKPAADNTDLEELWVYIKDAPLHEALRFGIIETQNQTSLHAIVPSRRTHSTKTFNGRVHFRYSGSDQPKEEVDEQLKVIERSFNDWAAIMNVEAGTGSGEPVNIDVAYIE